MRLGTFLGYAATAFFFLGFGAVFLALLITVLLWDSHRLLALGIFAALYLVIGCIAALAAARISRQGSRLFSASIAELEQDRDMIRPDNESENR
ncbi:MAG: phage holin family protein [Zoogloeaceae bacterium]|nr:phage holin family protein [Zoogloeaceae bacterium]